MCRYCTNEEMYAHIQTEDDKLSSQRHETHSRLVTCIRKNDNSVFQPMTEFRFDKLPLKIERRLLNLNLSPEEFESKKQNILIRPIHGLLQCGCCGRVYNRDKNASATIGDVGLDNIIYGISKSPFRRDLFNFKQ